MNIINGKFNPEELSKIYGVEPFMGNIRCLDIYNRNPEFNIQKFYNNGELVGYAALFLEENALENATAMLEDIVYWQGNPEELDKFLRMVLAAKDYPFDVKNIYFEPEYFEELIVSHLKSIGFKEKNRVR